MTQLRPLREYEEWVSLNVMRKIGVPSRVYTRRGAEVEEQIRRDMVENPETFFNTSPIIVTKSRKSGKMYLADGFDRCRIAIIEEIPKAKLVVKEFEDDADAVAAARALSYKINNQRGQVDEASLVKMVRDMANEGWSAKDIARLLEKSERYIRMLLNIGEDEEIVEMLERGEISIHRAVDLLRERKSHIAETVSKPPSREEKAPSVEISPKEAEIEGAKACTAISEEITPKMDQTAETMEAGESEEREILELMPRTIKSEMEKAFERLEDILGYELEDPEVRQRLLLTAFQDLMEETSEVQREAIRLWARQCKEDFHLYENFRQYILEAREIVKKRKAKLARLRARRNRRTAKHREKTIKTLKCPRCGTTLVCPSCGWPRKV